MMRFEKVELSDGGQQKLSVTAIDFVSKQMALERVFLDSILAFAADQQAVFGIVFEQIICAESDGRHNG